MTLKAQKVGNAFDPESHKSGDNYDPENGEYL